MYQIAMDANGTLYVAVRGAKHGPQMWERCPFVGAGALRHPPVDALARPVARPDWAVDAYLMLPDSVPTAA